MIADGLTKSLEVIAFKKFVSLLRLTSVKTQHQNRQIKRLANETNYIKTDKD